EETSPWQSTLVFVLRTNVLGAILLSPKYRRVSRKPDFGHEREDPTQPRSRRVARARSCRARDPVRASARADPERNRRADRLDARGREAPAADLESDRLCQRRSAQLHPEPEDRRARQSRFA